MSFNWEWIQTTLDQVFNKFLCMALKMIGQALLSQEGLGNPEQNCWATLCEWNKGGEIMVVLDSSTHSCPVGFIPVLCEPWRVSGGIDQERLHKHDPIQSLSCPLVPGRDQNVIRTGSKDPRIAPQDLLETIWVNQLSSSWIGLARTYLLCVATALSPAQDYLG